MHTVNHTLLRNQFFWLTNIFVWLSVHALMTHSRWIQSRDIEGSPSWLMFWYYTAPWMLLWIPITGGVFAGNRFISRRCTRKSVRFIAHAGLMLGLLLSYWSIAVMCSTRIRGYDLSERYLSEWIRIVSTSFQLDVLIYCGVLALAKGLAIYHRTLEDRLKLKSLQTALSREQLKSLRSQLNPHFLFNALNTVASLVRLKREKDAVNALSELSHMLRKILETKNESDIKIRDEIAFIGSYLAIQKLRFSDKLDTHIEVDEDCLDLEIPNMLLHPLVENAVQHGSQLESNNNPLRIEVHRSKDCLEVTMTNKVAIVDSHNGFGIGLGNTRERLQRLYTHFQLELRPLQDDLFVTFLAIPIGGKDA